jgi:fatty acid desaturase
MKPQMKFHLVFSLIMGALMISLMTFVITAVNLGFGPHFLAAWGRVFLIAYAIGVPVIFFLAPVARKLTGGLLGVQA